MAWRPALARCPRQGLQSQHFLRRASSGRPQVWVKPHCLPSIQYGPPLTLDGWYVQTKSVSDLLCTHASSTYSCTTYSSYFTFQVASRSGCTNGTLYTGPREDRVSRRWRPGAVPRITNPTKILLNQVTTVGPAVSAQSRVSPGSGSHAPGHLQDKSIIGRDTALQTQ